MNIAVLASGTGSNFAKLISHQDGYHIYALLCNNPSAHAINHAKNAGIRVFCPVRGDGRAVKLADFERLALDFLAGLDVDLLVLAGFMRVLSADFLAKAPPAINLHPSLLPVYKGLNTHARVLAAGDRAHGASVHWVNSELDGGQIIAQISTHVRAHDTVPSLSARVASLEHRLLPWVLTQMAMGRVPNGMVFDGDHSDFSERAV